MDIKTQRAPTKNFLNKPEWNILMMAIGYFLVFSAFRIVQAYATSYMPILSSISFAIIYIEYSLLAPFAPLVVHRIGFKISLLFSFTSFSLYIISYYIGNEIFLLICSVIVGFGGALKACIQGAFITQCANVYEYQYHLPYYSQLGWFKSLFYFWYSTHVTIAFIIAALFFTFYDSSSTLFLICSIISFASLLFISFLRPMSELKYIQNVKYHALSYSIHETWSSFHFGVTESGQIEHMTPIANVSYESSHISDHYSHSESTHENSTESTRLLEDFDSESTNNDFGNNQERANEWKAILFEGWNNPTLLSLVFITLSYGLNIEFFFAELPIFIDNTARTFYVLSVAGVTALISTLFAGKMADVSDASAFICAIACACNVVVFVLLLAGELYGFGIYAIDKLTLMYIISAIFGASGYLLLSQQSNILYAKLLGNQLEVFAKRSLIAYAATACSYFYRLYIPMYASIMIIMICNILGGTLLFLNEMNRKAFHRNLKKIFPV